MMIQINVLRKKSFASYIMMLSFCCPINLILKLFNPIILKFILFNTFKMVTMVTILKGSISCSFQIALAHQPVGILE